MNRYGALLVLYCAAASLGCNRAPQAVKVLGQAERAAIAPAAKSLARAEGAAAIPRGGRAGILSKANAERARGVVGRVDNAVTAFQRFQQGPTNPQPHHEAPVRFPFALSEVQPVGPAFVIDPVYGISASPNNFGGHIFYDRQGVAIGFSAYDMPSGMTYFFDRWGNLL
jgi:hypothetical protein